MDRVIPLGLWQYTVEATTHTHRSVASTVHLENHVLVPLR